MATQLWIFVRAGLEQNVYEFAYVHMYIYRDIDAWIPNSVSGTHWNLWELVGAGAQEHLPRSKCVIVALARCLSSRSTLVDPDWSTGALACRSKCMSVCGSRSMLVVPNACLWLSFDICQLTVLTQNKVHVM